MLKRWLFVIVIFFVLLLLVLLNFAEIKGWYLNWAFILRTWSIARFLEHKHSSFLWASWPWCCTVLPESLLIRHQKVTINSCLATWTNLTSIRTLLIVNYFSPSRMLTSMGNLIFINVKLLHVNVSIIVVEYHLTIFCQSSFISYGRHAQ